MKRNMLYQVIDVFMLVMFSIISASYNVFPFFISILIYKIIKIFFVGFDYKNVFSKSSNLYQTYIFLIKRVFLYLIGIGFVLIGLAFLMKLLLKLDDIVVIFIFMFISILIDNFLYITSSYFKIKRKKIGENIISYYNIISIILFWLITILSFVIGKTDDYLYLLYLSKIVSGLIILLPGLYFGIQKENKSKEANRLNYRINNGIIKDITIYLLIYLSIIMLYIILKYFYGFTPDIIDKRLLNIYFYDFILLVSIIKLMNYFFKSTGNYVEKLKSISELVVFYVSFLSASGGVLIYLFYNRFDNIIFLVFYVALIYLFVNICEYKFNKNYLYLTVIILLFSKILLTYPLIKSYLRMGYDIINGELLSSIISLIMAISLLMGYIIRKEKLSFSQVTEFVINKINKGIIIVIFLLILSIFVSPLPDTKGYALIVVLIYFIISYIINETLKKIFN